MSFDCCRSAGSSANPLQLSRAAGSIPGAVPGSIPEEFAASDPIYFDGLVSLDEFLASSPNDLDMRPGSAHDRFVWPVTSRFSFVSGVFLAAIAALLLCAQAQAREEKNTDSQKNNVEQASSVEQSTGRIISFVCGHPNTLQVLAPWDCATAGTAQSTSAPSNSSPVTVPARALPQGASPIAEMKYMPPVNARAKSLAMATRITEAKQIESKQTDELPTDMRSADRIYEKLVRLSLSDPSLYNAEAPSLITYFSILSGGHSQKRVAELESYLEKNLHSK